MIEKITLRVFLVCLLCCASLVLSIIWGGPPAEVFFKTTASLFVIGLASFLCWLVAFLYRLREVNS